MEKQPMIKRSITLQFRVRGRAYESMFEFISAIIPMEPEDCTEAEERLAEAVHSAVLEILMQIGDVESYEN
jgi:hypothetical protein